MPHRHSGFGIYIAVSLSIADKLILFINDLCIQNTAANHDTIEIHYRSVFYGMRQRSPFIGLQKTAFVDTSQNIIVIVQHLSGC